MDEIIARINSIIIWVEETLGPYWAQGQVYYRTEPAFRFLIYLAVVAALALLATFLVPQRKKSQPQAPKPRPVGPHAEAGESVLRFIEAGSGLTFFGFLPAVDSFLLSLGPGYEFSPVQEVRPSEVEQIVKQIDAVKAKGEDLVGSRIKTKWGDWETARFVEAHVEVVVNNHPYIREPEDISLLIAKVVMPGEKVDEETSKRKKDVFVLVDIIFLRGGRGWMHSKAHYWVGQELEPDELAELSGQIVVYQQAEPLGPEPLPIRD